MNPARGARPPMLLLAGVGALAFAAGFAGGWMARAPGDGAARGAGEIADATTRPGQISSLRRRGPGDDPSAGARRRGDAPTEADTTLDADERAARSVIEKMLAELDAGEKTDARSLMGRIQQLLDLGPAGMRAIQKLFESGEDVVFDRSGGGGRRSFFESPSLRVALLRSLADRTDPVATEIKRQVIGTSPVIEEVVTAARALEEQFPGQHTAAAVAQISKLLADLPKNASISDEERLRESRMALEFATRAGSAELLPLAEQLFQSRPDDARMYPFALTRVPPEEQAKALGRVAADPEIAARVADNARGLTMLDLTSNEVRATVAGLFANRMTEAQRDHFLRDLASGDRGMSFGRGRGGGDRSSPNEAAADPAAAQARAAAEQRRAAATQALLQEIAPYANTPDLQRRHAETLAAIQRRAGGGARQ